MPERNEQTEYEEVESITSEEFNELSRIDKQKIIEKKFLPTGSGFCYNGQTKHPYPIMKSSKESKKLFRVACAGGKNGRKDTLVTYWDNPQEYEKFMRRTNKRFKVKKSIVDKFNQRQLKLIEN